MFEKYFNSKKFDLLIGRKNNSDFFIKEKDRNSHTLILEKEFNKTNNLIIPSIKQDVENKNMGLIIIEQKQKKYEEFKEMFKSSKKKVINLNPITNNNIKFNPLMGKERDVIYNTYNIFNKLNDVQSIDILNYQKMLIKNSLIILKRYLHDSLTFEDLNIIIENSNNEGLNKYIIPFQEKINAIKDNNFYKISSLNAIDWFINDYYKQKESFYKTENLRNQIDSILNNEHLRRLMVDIKNDDVILDFKKILEDKYILNICTCIEELKELSIFFGLMLIDGIYNGLYNKNNNKMSCKYRLYINNLETYVGEKIIKLICIGGNLNLSIFSTIENINLIETDIRNIIIGSVENLLIFPGQSLDSIKYLSDKLDIDYKELYDNDHKMLCQLTINNKRQDVFYLEIL